MWKNVKNHINGKITYGASMHLVYLLSKESY